MDDQINTPIFNPFLPSYKQNPYLQFSKIRDAEPMQYSEALQAWVVFDYKFSKEILLNNKVFSSSVQSASGQIADLVKNQQMQSPIGFIETVINSDEPTHTRLRSLVHRAFLPKKIELLEEYVEVTVDEILQNAINNNQIEIMNDFAQPVPIKVIAKMLGVPGEDYKIFKVWSDNIIQAATNILPNQEIIERGNQSILELIDYFNKQIKIRKNGSVTSDILSELITAEEDGSILSDKELIAFIILLLVAGNETTTNFVGNGIASLISDNNAMDFIMSKETNMANVIEELFRINSPVIGVARFASTPHLLHDYKIGKGDAVLIMIGAANHDPLVFQNPDKIIFNRKSNNHLSFGHGIHYCLGASLARMESTIMLKKILPLIKNSSQKHEIIFDSTFFLRWPKKIDIAI
ncbi:MAG: cytochrome P450 [Dehalococcoidia bacterium]|nr:cytochrome P450 [Dehalococcoidia bacterium]